MNFFDKICFRSKWIEYAFSIIMCIVLLVLSLKLYNADLRMPFSYNGDALFFYAWTKTILENGWPFLNSYLGAPYGCELYDFTYNNTLDVLIIKILSLFSSNAILVENLFYLLTYPLTTLTSMIVFRQFKVCYAYSLLGSILFTFMPYHFLRGVSHLNLSSYFIVPLMVMVVLWVYSNEVMLSKSKEANIANSMLFDKKLIASIMICVLSGIVFFYYSYFFCIFLLIVGFLSSARTRKKAPLLTSIALIILVSSVVVLNQSPTIIYQHQNGKNQDASTRQSAETEIYGLKIIQLLLPIDGHRISTLSRFTHNYDITAPLVNENKMASLGIIGSLGFLILIGLSFLRISGAFIIRDSCLALVDGLSILNLSAVLFAVIGGFSSIIAYTILAQFRGINRISIFIAFFTIFAILIILKYISITHISPNKSNKWIYIIAGILILIGMFDQTSESFIPPYESIKEEYLNDRNFIDSVEAIMPEDSMVFQLPYVPFPEYPPINRMTDYSHLKGYLHSKDLRWSYGAMKGREGDIWQRLVANQDIDNMIRILSQFGFSGIYIDCYGYEDGAVRLISNITNILEVKPIVSDNKRLYFFDMSKYNQRIKTSGFNDKKVPAEFNSGWYGKEDWSGVPTRWMQADASILALSPDNCSANLSLNGLSFYHNRTLEISSNGILVAQFVVPTNFINMSLPISLAKGTNTVQFHVREGCERPCDKPELNNPDEKCLSVAVQNLAIFRERPSVS